MVSGRQRCCPESKRECEGVDPNRARRTQPTPRLYCSEGSPSALPFQVATGRRVRPANRQRQNGKATGVATRSAGAGRLFLYESSALSCRPQTLGRRGEPDGPFLGPRPASQETCHPRAWCPHWGGFPVASTEVVVATSCIRGSLSTRRCRSVFSGRASSDFLCMLKACAADRLRAVEGYGNP